MVDEEGKRAGNLVVKTNLTWTFCCLKLTGFRHSLDGNLTQSSDRIGIGAETNKGLDLFSHDNDNSSQRKRKKCWNQVDRCLMIKDEATTAYYVMSVSLRIYRFVYNKWGRLPSRLYRHLTIVTAFSIFNDLNKSNVRAAGFGCFNERSESRSLSLPKSFFLNSLFSRFLACVVCFFSSAREIYI